MAHRAAAQRLLERMERHGAHADQPPGVQVDPDRDDRQIDEAEPPRAGIVAIAIDGRQQDGDAEHRVEAGADGGEADLPEEDRDRRAEGHPHRGRAPQSRGRRDERDGRREQPAGAHDSRRTERGREQVEHRAGTPFVLNGGNDGVGERERIPERQRPRAQPLPEERHLVVSVGVEKILAEPLEEEGPQPDAERDGQRPARRRGRCRRLGQGARAFEVAAASRAAAITVGSFSWRTASSRHGVTWRSPILASALAAPTRTVTYSSLRNRSHRASSAEGSPISPNASTISRRFCTSGRCLSRMGTARRSRSLPRLTMMTRQSGTSSQGSSASPSTAIPPASPAVASASAARTRNLLVAFGSALIAITRARAWASPRRTAPA